MFPIDYYLVGRIDLIHVRIDPFGPDARFPGHGDVFWFEVAVVGDGLVPGDLLHDVAGDVRRRVEGEFADPALAVGPGGVEQF